MVRVFSFNSFNSNNKDISISGSEVVGLNLIKNSIREGFEVLLIGPIDFKKNLENLGESKLTKFYLISQHKNFHSNFLLMSLMFNYIYRTISTIFIIIKLRRKYKEILYYSVSDFFPGVIPPFVVKCSKWYFMSHHLYSKSLSFRSIIGRFTQYLSFLMSQYADKVIVTNLDCENFLKKNFRMKNLQRIFLGRDLEKFFKARSTKKDLKKILYVGRFNKTKGFLLLPDIFNDINKKGIDFSLSIVGNGEENIFQEFKKRIADLNLESKITIKRNLTNEELLLEMATSFILVQPSSEEGFSFVVLEGLASNLHIVAFDLPIYSKVYADFSLNLIKKGDVPSFSSKIISLLEEKKVAFYSTELFKIFDPKSTYKTIFN